MTICEDGDSEPNRITDLTSTNTLATDIIEAVCDHKGINPLKLEFSLYDYIDIEAVDALVKSVSSGLKLQFTLEDIRVYIWKSNSNTANIYVNDRQD